MNASMRRIRYSSSLPPSIHDRQRAEQLIAFGKHVLLTESAVAPHEAPLDARSVGAPDDLPKVLNAREGRTRPLGPCVSRVRDLQVPSHDEVPSIGEEASYPSWEHRTGSLVGVVWRARWPASSRLCARRNAPSYGKCQATLHAESASVPCRTQSRARTRAAPA